MSNSKSYICIILSIFISIIIVFVLGFKDKVAEPKEVYKVYIDGKLVGAVRSRTALENYINNEQKELKDEYNVDKVYLPSGIDIEKDITYDKKIYSEKEMYKKIKSKKKFTIKGYIVTISKDKQKDLKLYLIKKNIFDKSVKKVLNAFVKEDDVKNYKNNTQPKIKTTGSTIENISIDQDVSIKEAFISTDELIFTNETDLTKYLLFGSLDDGKEYTVKLGDTIESVAFNNKLSTDEFLIVNPEFTNSKNLLSVRQKVNIALIKPILDLVVDKNVIEDMDKPYSTIEKDDPNQDVRVNTVEVNGVNGRQRVTEKIRYINGAAQPAYISNVEILKQPINKVVRKGTKKSYGGIYTGNIDASVFSGSWNWPTVSPYVITSYFEWRWGRLHEGIDISGCGSGSPIYAIESGTVLETYSSCSNYGSISSTCGDGFGNYVWIKHPNNVYAVYGHLLNSVAVSPGQKVSKGDVIGYMGSSGSSTGTHLHLGVFYGGTKYGAYGGGTVFNPLSLY